ncbi:MAG TPA: nitronate monooxygenase, partial [Polyangia bacterium]
AAVSRAGALGTLGLVPADELGRQLARARALAPGRPLAVNLLMPFARRAHVDACIAARVAAVVLFFGYRRAWVARLRAAGVLVVHQVGTAAEARRALADGADALVAQGREAGGHLLGVDPAHAALAQILAVSDGAPVLLAGGVVDAAAVRAALAAGASGVACGTRFLLSDECRAHPGYKARVLGAPRTIETRLFGFGWPARHRVVPNAATERWCAASPDGPLWSRALRRLSAPLPHLVPMKSGDELIRAQRLSVPLYSPACASETTDAAALDWTPLYAGERARDVTSVLPAATIVRELAAGFGATGPA